MSSNNDQITVVVETDTGQAEYKKFQKMIAKGQGEAVEEAEQNMHRETELPDQRDIAAEKKPEKQDQAQQTKEQMKEAIKQRLADERQQENTHSNRM